MTREATSRRSSPRADGIEADRRLVEEEHQRVVDEPARDVHPLAHSARIALDPLLLTAVQPDELQQLVDPAGLVARRDAVELGEVAEVVVRGQPLVEAALAAEHIAHLSPHLLGVLDDVVAEHAPFSKVGISSVISILIVVVLPPRSGRAGRIALLPRRRS